VIELEGLTRVYQSGRGAVRAVDGLSLTVGNSEVFGLLGPNGAGKTTAIKMMTTLSRPDAGRCLVGGFDVVREPGNQGTDRRRSPGEQSRKGTHGP